ncbi:3-(3-hydroxy-phenyl)propionate hydroxylase [Amycolatopsis mediterranei S699]|uniref:3-(3-hydroxy-phenyl)propionate hydroxylase n=2 Tax=Amycolatopsis mediterranei TaxID=33910 RepID=A0A0H3D3G6_AMYMU|nr:FAD-dependent monooxygenase [Amycolatopsis mediterranei]ADJ44712.1 3-(3-hydroxy-phenyl)propionate hydroxylase [Amycolatopsis mediterranei U32]AEK41455.1 3-(3-hydroxy-phenyl)propionate hydroxylase [Amycolatopsis mediterranei S699]AFO76423.1 3-(3-hydroxy-phenyl)propionate hydroxylase [Amycolatopsis mediterranei S699]AGT83552.1 3-(3-hydroxy-phenyl)propionate hydroxylase [Amycolatopsis mediterranei RB]KDO07465.1 3-(3-hydroxyphenyl)propionate hydroxylase [Amycolatopsis mediterranei]
MDTDVLIVGAGPTGLTLANELRVAGVPTLLVDKLPQRSTLSKAGGVQSRTQEAFDQRGLLEPLLATGNHPTGTAHFAGITLSLTQGRHRHPWRSIPQAVIEGFLEQHLAAQGISVRRDHELTGLSQDEDGVTATFASGRVVRSRYLVAADGGRSTVRSLLGAEFPGRPGTMTTVAADVRLSGDDPVMTHTRSEDGHWASVFPLGTDPQGRPLRRLSLGGPGRSLPREVPVTEAEIRDGLSAVFGSRVQLLELRYARRITNAARQAAQYRHGRVFLAGDAAHVHLPIGAQGMNTGIQDALNLGWKLGAAVHGWAPDHLLDTYHAERHPVAAAVLRNVQAQSLLMDQQGTRDPDLVATKELFAALTQLRDVQYFLDDVLSGMGIRYPMPGTEGRPLVGLPAPDLDLGPVRSHELLRRGRGVLLDPADRFAKVAALWHDRVDRAGQGAGTEPMLIRPDGYVCWAGNPDDLEPALGHWFGEPH